MVILLTVFLFVILFRPLLVYLAIWRGDQYFMTGQYKDGLRSYRKAILLDPKNADVHDSLSYVYQRLSEPDNAIKEMNKAITLKPKDSKYRLNLARVLLFEKDYRAAITQLEAARRLAPKDLSIWNMLAIAYDKNGQPGKAVQVFHEMQRIFPNAKGLDERIAEIERRQ